MPVDGSSTTLVLLLFDPQNRVLLRRDRADARWEFPATRDLPPDEKPAPAAEALARTFTGQDTPVTPGFSLKPVGTPSLEVFFARCETHPLPPDPGSAEIRPFTIEELANTSSREPEAFPPRLSEILPGLRSHTVRIGYLNLSAHDYIYRFRTDRQRNREAYLLDEEAHGLYRSTLCEAIKQAKRIRERTSSGPALLDFGLIRYLLPSHFGFCLGVQNAIERAYETLSLNPGRRVFMLSELIHNPFVNQDLQARGLLYLQTDKGVALTDPATGLPYWESLTSDDIVIIPAFGATDEDKIRLITKGIAIHAHDATCMLVEKVWKVARTVGRKGYTVIIHGKAEHEETKATFSNTAQTAHALIVRNMEEARRLGRMILETDPVRLREELGFFAGRHTGGFDPSRHLDRIAVVNQTTLLRNETVAIIDYLESVLARKFGADQVGNHLYTQSGDTLCYATQVNQDSLEKALELNPDRAVVIGGRNSSNTYQLYRLCDQLLHEGAAYIQSERDILSLESISHYHFPYDPADPPGGWMETRPFLPRQRPVTLLVTGGASCPDGIIQQVIERINLLIGPDKLRPVDDVLREVTP